MSREPRGGRGTDLDLRFDSSVNDKEPARRRVHRVLHVAAEICSLAYAAYHAVYGLLGRQPQGLGPNCRLATPVLRPRLGGILSILPSRTEARSAQALMTSTLTHWRRVSLAHP
ncbi:hypothetical protein NKDENANG_00861 [Candidatus Entotheonellaceae bacterium PAL068K]